jgi:transcriptional regulator with XRE-family HTH domain
LKFFIDIFYKNYYNRRSEQLTQRADPDVIHRTPGTRNFIGGKAMSESFKREVAKRLAEARGNVSQNRLAKEIGYAQQHINRYERGYVPKSYTLLDKLARIKNISINWLLTGEGDMHIHPHRSDNMRPEEVLERIEAQDVLKKLEGLIDILIDKRLEELGVDTSELKTRKKSA